MKNFFSKLFSGIKAIFTRDPRANLKLELLAGRVLDAVSFALPAVKSVAVFTPSQADDKVILTVEEWIQTARGILGDKANDVITAGIKLGLATNRLRQDLLQAAAKGPVVLGDKVLRTIADVEKIPESELRLAAEATFNAYKTISQ